MPRKLKPPYDPQEEARQTIERIIRSEERKLSPLNQSIVRLDNWLYRHHFDAVFDYAGMIASFMAGVSISDNKDYIKDTNDTLVALIPSYIFPRISNNILQRQYDRYGIKGGDIGE